MDSTVELIRRHQARNDEVFVVFRDGLTMQEGELFLNACPITTFDDDANWHQLGEEEQIPASNLDMVAVRLEPPVDPSFRIICQMLIYAVRAGIPVFNDPAAILLREEKLGALTHSGLMPNTVVSTNRETLISFCAEQAKGCVIKPLDGMGGRGVFSFAQNDSNIQVAIDSTLAAGGTVMAQERLDVNAGGDCRVFIKAGKPCDLMIRRTPVENSHLANMASGGIAQVEKTGAKEREIVKAIGPTLLKEGVVFAGIDVIEGKLTEINITCTTGLRAVRSQTGTCIADEILDTFAGHL